MWVLVLINTVIGSAVAIPGYTSQATCSAAGPQEVTAFSQASGNNWAWLCAHPK
jgi:hypothetical protein